MGFFKGAALQRKSLVNPTACSLPKCGRCGLARKCISPRMAPTGRGSVKALFVAEAPGEQEDRQGVQLIGKAGQRLRQSLRRLGYRLDDCWKTNAVICRPPDNKMENKFVDACRPMLLKTIEKLKPHVIILMGGASVRSLIAMERGKNVGGITKWAGWTIPSLDYNAWLCPTYHPSYLLRMGDPVLDLIFEQHLKKAMSLEHEPLTACAQKDLEDQIEIILDPKSARKRLRDLVKQEGVLAFDYETTGLKPDAEKQRIVSCSFCLDGEDTFAIMIDGKRTLKLLSKVLRSKKTLKVASNQKFEERWTLAKMGHVVENWHWDTMLAAHCHDNRGGVTSVKFQAYVHFGVADYDSYMDPFKEVDPKTGLNRIADMDKRDLLIYNGMDSLVEFMVMVKQKQEMGL